MRPSPAAYCRGVRSGRINMTHRAAGGLVAAGVATMLSAALAAPAGAAPSVPQVVGGQTVLTFGTNQSGVLGNGTTNASLLPVRPSGLTGTPRQVAAGFRASAALMSDGTVWTWGNNHYAQLGYPSATDTVTTPRQVTGLPAIAEIALSGEGNGYAVGTDGSLWAWGDDSYGQLGNGTTTTTPSYAPVRVSGLTGVTQVAAGGYYVLALRSDGTVWAFGDNSGGYLGDGTTNGPRSLPQQVPGLSGITEVVAGGLESFAVRSDGTLFGWGQDTSGSLGLGTTNASVLTPTPVPGLTGVTQVATNGWGTLAVAGTALRLWAWGSNACGELGDGTTTDRTSPELTGLVGVTQIAMGDVLFLQVSSAAVRYDGTLWTWGCNSFGELGYGYTSGYVTTPTQVRTMAHVSQFAFGDDSANALFAPGEFGIAIGSLPVTVPSVTGDTTGQASAALQAAGLVLGTVSSVIDYTCDNIGTVVSQNPGAGNNVSPGTAVSVTIGKAPPPPHQCL